MEPRSPSSPTPPVRRLMVFIDGENLCARFADMAKDRTPTTRVVRFGTPKLTHVWHPATIQTSVHEILRATYYTSACADTVTIARIKQEIRALEFQAQHRQSGLPHTLTPFVGKRKSDSRASKGVDIKMTVDILTHCYNNNLDTAYIVTGDADFGPVIEERLRHGKQVYLAALSSGLSPELPPMVDKFIDLDPIFFEKVEPE